MKRICLKLTWRQPNDHTLRYGNLCRFGPERAHIRLAFRVCARVFLLFFHRLLQPPRRSVDLLAGYIKLPVGARVSLRLWPVSARLRLDPERPEEEVSESLHLVAGATQPDQERPGAGGLQLQQGPALPGNQTSHRALPAQNQQHGLHRSPAPVREGQPVPKRDGRLFIALHETLQRL